MRDQGDAHAVEFALDLGGLNRTAAHDAGPTSASMGFGHAIHIRQAPLGQPGADLTPQAVVGAATFIYHEAGAPSTGPLA